MSDPFLVFDFDNTIVDTTELRPYRKNKYGLEFVTQNINNFNTQEYSPAIKALITSFHSRGRVAIVTNSPQNQTQLLLQKHGFPNVPVYGNSKKPDTKKLLDATSGIDPNEVVVIGDHPQDILQATMAGMKSIGAMWDTLDSEWAEEGMILAGNSARLRNPDNIEKLIDAYNQGKLIFKGLAQQEDYENLTTPVPVIPTPTHHIGIYSQDISGYNNTAKNVFTYKNAKHHFIEQINAGASDTYFYNGKINAGQQFKYLLGSVLDKFDEIINTQIQGNFAIIPAPNSNPSYCYPLDTNHRIAMNIENRVENPRKRTIIRQTPVRTSHTSHNRTTREEHLNSFQILSNPTMFHANNLIILDDVRTTGTQIDAIAQALRSKGYEGNIVGMVIGQTQS